MNAIYASKLYQNSKYKEKINAAIADPINQELIKQLATYLDDDILIENRRDSASNNEQRLTELDKDGDNNKANDSKKEPSLKGTKHSGPKHTSGPSLHEGKADVNLDNDEDNKLDEPSGEAVEVETDINESEEIQGHSINASTDTSISHEVVEEIKGLLNMDASTNGVSHALIKDNELWIFYDDSINLNNIMSNVIERIHSSGYYYLQFNRLARSENSFVFEINECITAPEPEESDDE